MIVSCYCTSRLETCSNIFGIVPFGMVSRSHQLPCHLRDLRLADASFIDGKQEKANGLYDCSIPSLTKPLNQ